MTWGVIAPARGRARGRARAAWLAAGALVLLGSGCSAVQESLECPGEHCPRALRGVADAAAAVDGVTAVDRAWRFANLDKGSGGGVDVHASVSTRAQARPIALRLRDLYAASEVETVDTVSVRVVPEPERARPADQDVLAGGRIAPGAEPPCADDRCTAAVSAFRDAFAADPVAGVARLEGARWVAAPDGWKPQTRIEVDAPGPTLDASGFHELENRILEIAKDCGLTDIGDVHAYFHYRQRVEFSFFFRKGVH